jgi:hypothetical protein
MNAILLTIKIAFDRGAGTLVNRIPVMVPLTAPLFGVHFWGIFPSKIDPKEYSKEVLVALYGTHLHC